MVQIIHLSNQNNNHDKIKYIASNEHARSLLKHLLDVNDVTYDDAREYLKLKDEQTNTILNKLVEFGMFEQSHKWAHGYTKMLAMTYSTYTITDFGANFITNYDTLNNTNHESHTAQLSKGDFTKFKDMLDAFTHSNDDYQVREAYEFIFGTGSKNSNFYNLSKNKLLTTYRKLNDLKREIFKVIDINSYQNTIKKYDHQVLEFIEISKELNKTLQTDRLPILNYLNRFLNEATAENKTDFYERKAKQVFGVNMINEQASEENLTKIVTTFAKELIDDKIIDVYTDITNNIFKLAIQLGEQLTELNDKMQHKDESKPYYFAAALVAIVLFGVSIFMANNIENNIKQAIETKQYTITKKDKLLSVDSKSEYLKSKKFLIHFEDDSIIQIENEGHYYEIDKTKETVVE